MKTFLSTLLIVFFLAGTAGSIWAHGGGHKSEPKKEEATLPKLPESTIDTKNTNTGAIDYGTGDSMDAFEMEEVGDGGPLWGEEPPAEKAHEDHDMSKMQHVKPAEHEWISTSQKGYKWAAAATVLSAVFFGFLTFKRPCE